MPSGVIPHPTEGMAPKGSLALMLEKPKAIDTSMDAPEPLFGLRRAYVVRVMIPCYKESLAITQRTVYAARRADRPFGMRLVIYLCDDGSDPKKRDWISYLGDPNIIYVTGVPQSALAPRQLALQMDFTARVGLAAPLRQPFCRLIAPSLASSWY
jgi:hypothetical protein